MVAVAIVLVFILTYICRHKCCRHTFHARVGLLRGPTFLKKVEARLIEVKLKNKFHVLFQVCAWRPMPAISPMAHARAHGMYKSTRAKAAALPVIVSIIGPRETHDYLELNL